MRRPANATARQRPRSAPATSGRSATWMRGDKPLRPRNCGLPQGEPRRAWGRLAGRIGTKEQIRETRGRGFCENLENTGKGQRFMGTAVGPSAAIRPPLRRPRRRFRDRPRLPQPQVRCPPHARLAEAPLG